MSRLGDIYRFDLSKGTVNSTGLSYRKFLEELFSSVDKNYYVWKYNWLKSVQKATYKHDMIYLFSIREDTGLEIGVYLTTVTRSLVRLPIVLTKKTNRRIIDARQLTNYNNDQLDAIANAFRSRGIREPEELVHAIKDNYVDEFRSSFYVCNHLDKTNKRSDIIKSLIVTLNEGDLPCYCCEYNLYNANTFSSLNPIVICPSCHSMLSIVLTESELNEALPFLYTIPHPVDLPF